MSKVISFRLNPDNPRDAKALDVLQEWISQGFSTRHTITEALLQLDSANSNLADSSVLNDLSQQIKELLDNIGSDVTLNKPKNESPSQEKLSEGFVTSLLKAAKPGLKMAGKTKI